MGLGKLLTKDTGQGILGFFLLKEGWRLDCFVLSLVVLNFNEAVDVAPWETPTQWEMDTGRKEHEEGWAKGLSEVGEAVVHIFLEESISLMAESIFKVYWLLKGISFRCSAQQSTSSVPLKCT